MRLLGPALYFSVLLFNIAVTFYIGEMLLGLVDLLLLSVLLVPMVLFTFYKNSNISAEAVIYLLVPAFVNIRGFPLTAARS